MAVDVLGAAVARAVAHQEELVPCPVCGASAKGRNFPTHLDKHADASVGTSWRSVGRTWRHPFGATLSVEDGVVTVGRKHVRPERVELGGLLRSRPDMVSGTGGSDVGSPSVDEPAGTYLAVGRIVVRCATSTDVRRHWTGWTPGKKRKRWRLSLAPGDFVAFQYALAELGVLQPR